MEPTNPPLKVFVGDFEVVQVTGMAITLHLGKHVHATIHLPIEHTVKAGDTLPIHGAQLCQPWISINPMT